MTLRIHDADAAVVAAKAVTPLRIQADQSARRVAENVVHVSLQRVVHQTHAGVEIIAVGRRLAQVFTEHHGVVPRFFRVEKRFAQIHIRPLRGGIEFRVVEPAREVKLALRLPEVTVVVVVLVRAEGRSEKVVADVLDRIQAQTVGLRAIHQPAGRPVQKILDVLPINVRVLRVVQNLGGDAVVRAEADIGPIRQIAVVLRVVRLPDKFDLGKGRSFGETEILVGCSRLLGQIDQIGEVPVLHLPGVVPIGDVVPFPIEPFLRHAQVKVFRDQAGINIDRRRCVVARHIERIVIHHVVEIDADAEAMGGFDQAHEIRFRAITGAHRAALIFAAQIKAIPNIITDGKPAAAFGRRRQPE